MSDVRGHVPRSGDVSSAARSDAIHLLRQVRRLELAARRNAVGLLASDYLTAIPGRGMIFHETRKYVPGEPVRRIDWNITARLGEPYVKVHLEERQREVFVALDVSPSMHSGLGAKTKLEVGVELAATLAVSAINAGDRLGHILFADQLLASARPRGGRGQLFRTLRALLAHTAPWTRPVAESDVRAAVHAVERHRRGRFVVFLISDFIDRDLPDDLKYLRSRHDVSLLHVYDPLEYAAPDDAVRFPAFAPEGPTDNAAPGHPLRPGETGDLATLQAFLRQRCGRYGLGLASFSTALPVASTLDRYFHHKRRQQARRP